MTRFWEPLSDERARVLVEGWGIVPTESLRSGWWAVARRLDRSGRPFEALGLLSAAMRVGVGSVGGGRVGDGSPRRWPRTVPSRWRRRRRSGWLATQLRESGGELGPDWCLVQGHALGDLGHVDEALRGLRAAPARASPCVVTRGEWRWWIRTWGACCTTAASMNGRSIC